MASTGNEGPQGRERAKKGLKVIHMPQINFAILKAFSNFDLNLMG